MASVEERVCLIQEEENTTPSVAGRRRRRFISGWLVLLGRVLIPPPTAMKPNPESPRKPAKAGIPSGRWAYRAFSPNRSTSK